MKTYDRVLKILNEHEKARNSDKFTIWQFWVEEGKAVNGEWRDGYFKDGYMNQSDFTSATSAESIRRCRQKIQETHPELQATNPEVIKKRKQKEASKGTFIYREDPETGRML